MTSVFVVTEPSLWEWYNIGRGNTYLGKWKGRSRWIWQDLCEAGRTIYHGMYL